MARSPQRRHQLQRALHALTPPPILRNSTTALDRRPQAAGVGAAGDGLHTQQVPCKIQTTQVHEEEERGTMEITINPIKPLERYPLEGNNPPLERNPRQSEKVQDHEVLELEVSIGNRCKGVLRPSPHGHVLDDLNRWSAYNGAMFPTVEAARAWLNDQFAGIDDHVRRPVKITIEPPEGDNKERRVRIGNSGEGRLRPEGGGYILCELTRWRAYNGEKFPTLAAARAYLNDQFAGVDDDENLDDDPTA